MTHTDPDKMRVLAYRALARAGEQEACPCPDDSDKANNRTTDSVLDALAFSPEMVEARLVRLMEMRSDPGTAFDAEIVRLRKLIDSMRNRLRDLSPTAGEPASSGQEVRLPTVTREELRRLLEQSVHGAEELGRSLKACFRLPGVDYIDSAAQPPPATPPPGEQGKGGGEGLGWAGAFQERIAAWVVHAFGAAALTDRWERTARVVEEVIELAQAEGLDDEDVYRVLKRVYARPRGTTSQEAAGLMVCFLAWAAGTDTDLRAVTLTEIERIERPEVTERIRAKQAEKAKAGTGKGYPLAPAQPAEHPASGGEDRCTGTLVHDPHALCPVHDR